jgi:hypothetical protein
MPKIEDRDRAKAADAPKRGPLGDVLPGRDDPKETPGGQAPEDVEDRPNVGTVTPEDYPDDQRAKG